MQHTLEMKLVRKRRDGKVFGNDWDQVLCNEINQPHFIKLMDWVDLQYTQENIFPPKENIFEALKLTSFADTKVIIIGQDPYHGAGQAHGLSFSVRDGVKIPPSLRNIYKEMVSDLGIDTPTTGDLTPWAQQGVLLLNNVLTVREGEAASHQGKGWEVFTDAVIEALNQREQPMIFVLWGAHAQKKGARINTDKHVVLSSAHPSPLSARRGFFGSKPFSTINGHLVRLNQQPIDWSLI